MHPTLPLNERTDTFQNTSKTDRRALQPIYITDYIHEKDLPLILPVETLFNLPMILDYGEASGLASIAFNMETARQIASTEYIDGIQFVYNSDSIAQWYSAGLRAG
jgi:hypothetical protein